MPVGTSCVSSQISVGGGGGTQGYQSLWSVMLQGHCCRRPPPAWVCDEAQPDDYPQLFANAGSAFVAFGTAEQGARSPSAVQGSGPPSGRWLQKRCFERATRLSASILRGRGRPQSLNSRGRLCSVMAFAHLWVMVRAQLVPTGMLDRAAPAWNGLAVISAQRRAWRLVGPAYEFGNSFYGWVLKAASSSSTALAVLRPLIMAPLMETSSQ